MATLLERIRGELRANADEDTRKSFQRFFKEPMKCYGVKTGTVNTIAKRHYPEVKQCSKKEIYTLCETLYASGFTEEAFVANILLPRFIKLFEKTDLKMFKRWIETYIDNWAKCDGLCNHTIGDFVRKYPDTVQELKHWTNSPNRWLRRAAAVSLIVPAKKGDYLHDAFEIANQLLLDEDDMVQKGYGWLLKEESRMHPKEVFDYILCTKDRMPRTALRYAIELLPTDWRQQAMKKERKKE